MDQCGKELYPLYSSLQLAITAACPWSGALEAGHIPRPLCPTDTRAGLPMQWGQLFASLQPCGKWQAEVWWL